MTNSKNRTRVQSGVTEGGQFAAEAKSEAAGVTLTAPASALDAGVLDGVHAKVRTNLSNEISRWQRQMDRVGIDFQNYPMPDVLTDMKDKVDRFKDLDRDARDQVLTDLKLEHLAPFLEPGQKLGNEKVAVAAGVQVDPEDSLTVMQAQQLVVDAGLPGDITLTGVERHRAIFSIEDGGVTHALSLGDGSTGLSVVDHSDDYTQWSWLNRADTIIGGRSFGASYSATALGSAYKDHHEYAAMMGAVSNSAFRDHEELLGEFDREVRSVEIRADGTEFILKVDGDPVLESHGTAPMHPSMTKGFLDYVAEKTDLADGDAFANELREVFRETDRRLIR